MNVIFLFTSNINEEPPAILQDYTSGEYYPYHFDSWKYAVHFLFWMHIEGMKKKDIDKAYTIWLNRFINEDDELIDGINLFRCEKSDKSICVDTSIGLIYQHDDLDSISAWHY